jgi:hypothetical protein
MRRTVAFEAHRQRAGSSRPGHEVRRHCGGPATRYNRRQLVALDEEVRDFLLAAVTARQGGRSR